MDQFNYQDGQLFAEQNPVTDLASRFGTPLYVYSRATIERHFKAFETAADRSAGAIKVVFDVGS